MQKYLTSEQIKQRFSNTFDLVIYAIKIAKEIMRSGRACRVPCSIQNPAYQSLAEIEERKDLFEPAPDEEVEQPVEDAV